MSLMQIIYLLILKYNINLKTIAFCPYNKNPYKQY